MKRTAHVRNTAPLLLWLLLTACRPAEKTIKPSYKMLTEAIYASGNLLPLHDYQLYAMADGYLTQRLVDEGDTVKANQPLFRIESDVQHIRSNNALATYQTAKSNYEPALAELEAGLGTAKAKMANDSVNFIRFKNLLQYNATSQIEFDRVALVYKTSQNDYYSWKKRYQKTRNQLRMELQNANSNYQISNEENANFLLKSQIDGMVYEVYKKQGEAVKRQEAIARIGDRSRVYLQLSVDELDIDKLRVGQETLVKIDTYQGKVFKARITKIYPMLNLRDQTFRADAEFTEEAPKNLYAGLTVEANVIIRQKNQALTIPKSYLQGKDSVLVKAGDDTKTVRIQKGIENMEYVEVLSGLDTSSLLINPVKK